MGKGQALLYRVMNLGTRTSTAPKKMRETSGHRNTDLGHVETDEKTAEADLKRKVTPEEVKRVYADVMSQIPDLEAFENDARESVKDYVQVYGFFVSRMRHVANKLIEVAPNLPSIVPTEEDVGKDINALLDQLGDTQVGAHLKMAAQLNKHWAVRKMFRDASRLVFDERRVLKEVRKFDEALEEHIKGDLESSAKHLEKAFRDAVKNFKEFTQFEIGTLLMGPKIAHHLAETDEKIAKKFHDAGITDRAKWVKDQELVLAGIARQGIATMKQAALAA